MVADWLVAGIAIGLLMTLGAFAMESGIYKLVRLDRSLDKEVYSGASSAAWGLAAWILAIAIAILVAGS